MAANLFSDNDAIKQILLWQVAGQLIAPVLAPVAQGIASRVWEGATTIGGGVVSVPLSPQEAALGVLRGNISHGDGASIAGKSGTDGQDFDRMVANTGEPPAIEQMLFLQRRGDLKAGDLERAIRQSRVRDEWISTIEKLITHPITAGDAIDAVVASQIDEETAKRIVFENGIDDAGYTILKNTRGRPPSPVELIEMVRRGHIKMNGLGPDAITLEQGIHESDIKNKWEPVFEALTEYLPPPRTVTALLREGSIDTKTALQLFQDAGLTPQLAAVYVASATHTRAATTKTLSQQTITQLYEQKLITEQQATAMLEHLGLSAEEAAFTIQLGTLQHHQRILNAAITRVASLFIGRKIELPAASADLDALGVPADQRDELLTTWQLERAASLKILSETAIAAAWKYNLFTDDEAMAALQAHGYTPYDSWVYLAIHNKGTGPAAVPPRSAIHGALE